MHLTILSDDGTTYDYYPSSYGRNNDDGYYSNSNTDYVSNVDTNTNTDTENYNYNYNYYNQYDYNGGTNNNNGANSVQQTSPPTTTTTAPTTPAPAPTSGGSVSGNRGHRGNGGGLLGGLLRLPGEVVGGTLNNLAGGRGGYQGGFGLRVGI